MKLPTKPRKKRDGSVELPFPCPCCGSGSMSVNSLSGLFHCFSCQAGGVAPSQWCASPFLSPGATAALAPSGTHKARTLTTVMPLMARQEIRRRGFEEAWIVHRYGVRWDGDRLSWPTGTPNEAAAASEDAGWSRRAVVPWERPKTLTVGPKGLIGGHLVGTGRHLVVTEGDWKAAAIPLPWVGLGLCGLEMTAIQEWTIRCSNPASVTLMLDGGFHQAMEKIKKQLLPLDSHCIELPEGCGPDDISRRDLLRLLRTRKEGPR